MGFEEYFDNQIRFYKLYVHRPALIRETLKERALCGDTMADLRASQRILEQEDKQMRRKKTFRNPTNTWCRKNKISTLY